MIKLQTKPTRNVICACLALAVMTLLWHRVRAPLEKVGGIIASPPQHEDLPGGHAIVKFKNYKPLPHGFVNMNDALVDTRLWAGKDARIRPGTPRPTSRLTSSGSERPKAQESPSFSASSSKPLQEPSRTVSNAKSPPTQALHTAPLNPKIAKVSMLYGSFIDPINIIAMNTQEDYASLHNYPMHIMRREIIPSCRGLPIKCNQRDAHGLAGMWNKELYLQSILTAELAKPDSERVDWLMWQDGDTLTVNPSIPLDVFLPRSDMPGADQIHMLATKDGEGLNSGVFFLRVSAWSVRFLTACLAVPMTASPDEDLGWSYDQSTMARLLGQDEQFKSGIVYQPRRWYNAYNIGDMYPPGRKEDQRGPEEEARGLVLNVHFPGMAGDQRGPVMEEWLQKLEEEEGWDKTLEETGLLEEVEAFWKNVNKGKVKELRRIMQT